MKQVFNRKIFTNMLKASEQYPSDDKRAFLLEKQAYEYRSRTLGEEMPEKYVEKTEEIELTSELMRKLLKDNEIKFFSGAKKEKLYELCLENKLIEA